MEEKKQSKYLDFDYEELLILTFLCFRYRVWDYPIREQYTNIYKVWVFDVPCSVSNKFSVFVSCFMVFLTLFMDVMLKRIQPYFNPISVRMERSCPKDF